MKKFAVISLSLVAASAFATGYGPYVSIEAPSVQITALTSTAVANEATSGGEARQNLASNTGNVAIETASLQAVAASSSLILNKADGYNAQATQSLASNVGNVGVEGLQVQLVAASNSAIMNVAGSNSKAVQNVSTNNGCQACN
ncbi:hypothetical protein [Paracidovorax wautersii]|uniref:hypothetical protein n=1 Tax=Paracidovorax wautersii TaxID=1177982 RepID=UPI0031CF53CB